MRRLSGTLLFLAFLFVTPQVSACINDREVVNAEREFKSNYLKPQTEEVSPGENGAPERSDGFVYGLGGLLLTTAVLLGFVRTGKSNA